MGGQACVLYGGAEFSRDIDFVIEASEANLARFGRALDELQAQRIAIPPFKAEHLDEGLAVHFRCQAQDVTGLRIDIMTRLRGVAGFEHLWQRRTTLEVEDLNIELLSLPDLVAAKKTQRDKDWPMVTRLVEANYFANLDNPSPEQIDFWFQELRTPQLLIDLAQVKADRCEEMRAQRPLLEWAVSGDHEKLREELKMEEERERRADREYWAPLKRKLWELRQQARGSD